MLRTQLTGHTEDQEPMWIELRTTNDTPIFLNMALACFMTPDEGKSGTYINFSGREGAVFVKQSVAEILRVAGLQEPLKPHVG
jgi:hypothetical protein